MRTFPELCGTESRKLLIGVPRVGVLLPQRRNQRSACVRSQDCALSVQMTVRAKKHRQAWLAGVFVLCRAAKRHRNAGEKSGRRTRSRAHPGRRTARAHFSGPAAAENPAKIDGRSTGKGHAGLQPGESVPAQPHCQTKNGRRHHQVGSHPARFCHCSAFLDRSFGRCIAATKGMILDRREDSYYLYSKFTGKRGAS